MSNSKFRQHLFNNGKGINVYIGEDKSGIVEAHIHDFYQLMFVLEGQVLEIQGGVKVLQNVGECYFTPVSTEHSLYIFENTRYFCVSFSQDIADALFAYFPKLQRNFKNLPAVFAPSKAAQATITQCLYCLLEEQKYSYESDTPFQTSHLLLMTALIIMLREEYSKICASESTSPMKTSDERINRCLTHIDENLACDLSADDLAATSALSKSELYKRFRSATGKSIKQYINEKRINSAIRLMSVNELSLNEISEKVGYNDFSTFYRNFTAIMGISPSVFRNTVQLSNEK